MATVLTRFLSLLLIFITASLHAQPPEPGKEINLRVTNGRIEALIFKELWTGKVVKEITLTALNPYTRRTNGKKVAKDGTHYVIANSRIVMNVSDSATYFIAVSFAYYPIDEDNVTIVDKMESTVFVFDRKGEEVMRLEGLPYDAKKPVLSKDGNYLGLYFGELLYDAVNKYVGFQIFHVRTKTLIHNITAGDIYGELNSGMMVFIDRKGQYLSQYYVYNPKSKRLYTRLFSVVEFPFIRRYTEDGVVLRMTSGIEITLPYEEAFSLIEGQ